MHNGNDIRLPKHFYSLDVLRGLGALVIVFNHWPNLLSYQVAPPILPLHWLLWPLYDYGWRAVDMFFCLSGFVFFWLYSEKIVQGKTGGMQFAILRFSRLYPLHLVTLIVVALGQFCMTRSYGSWLTYKDNDLPHFISQLFFSSAWIAQNSFNGPTWSVSVEIFLYFCFFAICWFRLISWRYITLFVCLGIYWHLHPGPYLSIARGVLGFFMGGLTFHVFMFLLRKNLSSLAVKMLVILAMGMWLLVPAEVENNYIFSLYESTFPHAGLESVIGHTIMRVSEISYELFLFPVTICVLALVETRRGTLGRRLAFVGDISYSSYLLHFPLQIFFMLLVYTIGVKTTFFESPFSVFLFFLVLSNLFVQLPVPGASLPVVPADAIAASAA